WVADTTYLGRTLSTHFQFGDLLTFGTYLGKEKRWHIAYKFFHHSNGEVVQPNHGFGMELVSIGYRY
ncbi:MAG: acyloxyacyl hydrolase, partial [Thiovulaceae bacterium]|nr:acyloxyacyl hydrolase [Sulfurimonadaceae bacterium]